MVHIQCTTKGFSYQSKFEKGMIFVALDKNGKLLPKGITWRAKEGRYMGRFQHEGKVYTRYNANKTALIREMDDLKHDVIHGVVGKADKLTFGKWFQVWLDDFKRGRIKETSYNNYLNLYKNNLEEPLGRKQLDSIKPLHIQRLYTELLEERGISTKYLSNINSMLYNVFKIAIHNGLLVKNPCEGVDLPKMEQKEKRVLTVQEQALFLEYLHTERWQYYEPLFIFMLGTGVRIGEALGLQWSDVDFENREVHINHTLVYTKNREYNEHQFSLQSPKTATSKRAIPMNDDVYRALRQQWKNIAELHLYMGEEWKPLKGFENIVFVGYQGRPRQTTDIGHTLKDIIAYINKEEEKKATERHTTPFVMEDFHPHTLRHTFATRAFEAGVEGKVVQAYLGHASIKMTLDTYTHVASDKLHEDMQKIKVLQIG